MSVDTCPSCLSKAIELRCASCGQPMFDELHELREQNEKLADTLEDVLLQACGDSPVFGSSADQLDSLALTAYAEGLLLLAEFGRVKVLQHSGRRVIAERVKR